MPRNPETLQEEVENFFIEQGPILTYTDLVIGLNHTANSDPIRVALWQLIEKQIVKITPQQKYEYQS